jgi:hypothetical protein
LLLEGFKFEVAAYSILKIAGCRSRHLQHNITFHSHHGTPILAMYQISRFLREPGLLEVFRGRHPQLFQ